MFLPPSIRRGINHVGLTLVTPPAVEPVTLEEFKTYARIPYNAADDTLQGYITAARDTIERFLRRALITQTWDMIMDWGPAWVELPKPPLQTVVGVFYTDLANTEHPVDVNSYYVNTNRSLVSLVLGGVWPLHRGNAGFRIRFTAGYGDTASSVPQEIKRQIMALASNYDINRQDIMTPSMRSALYPYRREGLPYRMAPGWAANDIEA